MAKILHKVKAYLYPNVLTDDPNDFTARVSSERSLGVKEICASAVARGGAPTTAEAMEHNVNLFLKEMGYQLSDGFSINTGYFTATTLVKGVFHSATEKFNPEKHSILFQFNQGELLRRELPGIEVDVLGVGDSNLSIVHVQDVKTGSVNDRITPNRNLRIKGYKLKLAGDNEAVGIYFVNNATEERIKVEADEIVTNNPSELVVVTPELATGVYRLEVTTQYAVSSILKEPRTTVFENLLTVE